MQNNKPLMGSTSLIAETRFKAHGRIDMWMQDDMLHYDATGPFNEEVFDLLAVAQTEFLNTLTISGPWGSVVTLRNSAMSTPDGVERYTELMQRPKPSSLEPVATAFVIAPEIEGGRLMTAHFAKIYASINRPFKAFTELKQAEAWLQSMVNAAKG
ncbi:MAG: hypothetical protein ABIZ09_18150 [Rhodoferax sp.]